MRSVAAAFAWIVCTGACAAADGPRTIEGALRIVTDAPPGAEQRPRPDLPQTVLPQVPLPDALLASPGNPPAAHVPDPRAAAQGSHRVEPPRGRTCFSQAETRDNIASHRLSEPVKAMHVGRQQGEPLRARLCRWKPDEYIYEVSVLRRDGRVVHIYMNARNGQTVGAFNENDRK